VLFDVESFELNFSDVSIKYPSSMIFKYNAWSYLAQKRQIMKTTRCGSFETDIEDVICSKISINLAGVPTINFVNTRNLWLFQIEKRYGHVFHILDLD